MKLYQIIPNLYQRGDTLRVDMAHKMAELDRLNIGLVVNLWNGGFDPVLQKAFGRDYLLTPIQDGQKVPGNANAFWPAVEMAAYRLEQGSGVLVQCHAGRNRSSLFSALVVRQVLWLTGREAANIVLNKRPNAFGNRSFLEYLQMLDVPLREQNNEVAE